jgi:hypothetical protein
LNVQFLLYFKYLLKMFPARVRARARARFRVCASLRGLAFFRLLQDKRPPSNILLIFLLFFLEE